MREILFRGKRVDNGEWVYGDLIHVDDSGFDNYIEFEVIPETVGQYTGLTDKNGKKIFEGDILAVETSNISVECDGYFKVGYDNGTAAFVCEAYNYCITFDNVYGKDVEVVGNVFDNPELIKERECGELQKG